MGFRQYALIWTFDPSTLCTRHISESPRGAPETDKLNTYALLQAYSRYLTTPYALLMASAVAYTIVADKSLEVFLKDILAVEGGTKFSWDETLRAARGDGTDPDSQRRYEVDALTRWSRISARVQSHLAHLLRHQTNCMKALETIGMDAEKPERGDRDCHPLQNDYDACIHDSLDWIDVLKMQADSFVSYAQYLKSRADAQTVVVNDWPLNLNCYIQN